MTAILDKPVECGLIACTADAFGPPDRPRCPDHGGPDLQACGVCHRTIADDAEQFDCTNFYDGPIHVGCHPSDCRSSECAAALDEPTDRLEYK